MIRLAALAAHFYSRRQETTEKIMDFKTARRQTLLTALLLAAGAPQRRTIRRAPSSW
jgi:hypothetical protein